MLNTETAMQNKSVKDFYALSEKEQKVLLSILRRKPFARLDYLEKEGKLKIDKSEFDSIREGLVKKGWMNKTGRMHPQVQKTFAYNKFKLQDGKVFDADKEESNIKILSKHKELAYGFRNMSQMRQYFTPGDKFTIERIVQRSPVKPVKELRVGSIFTVYQVTSGGVWLKPKRGNEIVMDRPENGVSFYKDITNQGFTQVTDNFNIEFQRV